MAKWDRKTLELKKGHSWKARPGYRIFVADRGAVRFDVPDDWAFQPDADSFKFHDAEPPDDDCVLAVSFNRLPPVNWDGAPIAEFLKALVAKDERGLHASAVEIIKINRFDMRLVWSEHTFIDPIEMRDAHSRILIGIGGNVQCLITLDYWPEDAARVTPVWNEVLRTLKLGVHIPDPTTGAAIIPWLN